MILSADTDIYIYMSLIGDASPFADVFFWIILCKVAQAGKSAVCT